MFIRLARGISRSVKLLKLENFVIPQPGEGIAEVEIVQWLVKPNQAVSEFEILCEARSDKGFIEYKSPFAGVIKEICFKTAEMAQIGSVLYKIDVEGKSSEKQEKKEEEEEQQQGKEEPGSPEIVSRKSHYEPDASSKSSDYPLPNKVLATPATRNLARKLNVELTKVTGTGPDRRVTSEDVKNYVEGLTIIHPPPPSYLENPTHIQPPPMPKISFEAEDKIVKLTPVQRAMLKSMTESLKIPHLTYCEDVYMDQLISLKNQLKVNIKNLKLTFMPFFIKALSLAILDFPIVNSTLNESKNEYLLKNSHNVSFAMDTPFGLIVPNIKEIQLKSVYEIAQEMGRIVDLGAKGKITDSDLKGGTIALSNIGSVGGTYVAPVIMPPHVFIGAFGSTRPRLEKENGEIVEKQVLKTSWSADHRLVDGATTARFVARWKALIENPSLMLLHLK